MIENHESTIPCILRWKNCHGETNIHRKKKVLIIMVRKNHYLREIQDYIEEDKFICIDKHITILCF